jgi:hypothetical protein
VFEAVPDEASWRPGEWGISVHWGLPYLEKLLPAELFARLNETQTDPTYVVPETSHFDLFNMKTGDVFASLPLPKTIRFSRGKMRQFCTQGIEIQVWI